ncbi:MULTISPECIES: AfsR/SARP family transcriptional regulator [unclassified Streptomyces]|uniref:AfsR/SARP family transcriptional regulator n=1 Tax=unclassified Streptomyces TaxID=2593676 RepID=UPI002E2D5BA5|nr:BTAD domain-containing putative transcriptional regulator [Streptomyces sp. NBC_00223]
MEFRVLGALEVWSGPVRLRLGGPRERKVLALLLLEANRTVSLGHLVDALWDEAPPATADKQIRNAVSRLRAILGAGPGENGDLTAVGDAGYRMTVTEGALDAAEFDREVAAAERAAAANDLAGAADLLRTALDRWRGPALAGMSGRLIEAGAAAWDERRLAVQETWTDHQLALGRHTRVVAGLSATVAAHPLREKPVGQLMLALHRGGRSGDALGAYQELRTRLAEEMGLDPGPGLRELHQRILTNDPAIAAPRARAQDGGSATEARIPRQLPAAVRHFTGRRRHLKALDELLDQTADFGGGTAVISAIDGTAGIGKTSLALHWAQRNADRFPDGQLHVNLRGFAPGARPMAPTEAVRCFLEALGVPTGSVPQDLDARTALYRSLVAGRRMLVVLDNARDTDQVRPLLPGTPSCVVVVTSRNQLAGLVAAEGAVPVTLDLLSDCESHDLLARRLGPERTAAEPEATAALVDLCARLPLALSIAAARAVLAPRLSLADLVTALHDVRGRLDTLDIGDPTTDLRAVFSWSYAHLAPAAARMFRLLSTHPGPDITAPAAASLTGVPATDARRALGDLIRARLVVEHTPGRYTFHDLLRAYAAELAATYDTDEQRKAAVLRVLDHYLHTSYAAERLLNPDPIVLDLGPPQPGTTPEALNDARRASHWMETEYQVIIGVLSQGDIYDLDAKSSRLAWTVMSFIDRRGPRPAPTTPREPYPSGRIRAQLGLGPYYSWLVGYPAALTHLQRFAAVYRELDDDTGLSHISFGLSSILEHQGRYDEALEQALLSLELFTRIGHRPGRARATNAVGWLLGAMGDHRAALPYCERALDQYRELDDRPMQVIARENTGRAHHGLGGYEEAVAAFTAALALAREVGDPYEEAVVLGHLVASHWAAGDSAAADRARALALDLIAGLDGEEAAALRESTGL